MQNSQLDRLLKLAKRTGDRLIVTGNDGSEPVVILPLAEYEGMLDSMTFFRGQTAEASDDQHLQAGFAQDVGESTVEESEDFDPVALEKQVMAAMTREEPEVVPVETQVESQAMPIQEEAARKPITRKVSPTDDGGEERFYLEAV